MNKRFIAILGALLLLAVAAWQSIDGVTVRAIGQAPDLERPRLSAPASIEQLTQHQQVVKYLQAHHRLPDFYITKQQAREKGWNPKDGNLCKVLPGKAIGGDRFSNRERQLPDAKGRNWREADVNYRCGHRGADRLLYSNDGLIYLTQDHYKHFIRME
ncbi:ribonuclease [Yersinia kristensenii]|uniref:Ribonuclease n=1 Tax=Yersinia kristensenii TaxID=28152 RepID=A0A0T9LWH0_YERKR|nr:ribonuclease [Yersinia kristensenii]MDA5523877.1 ribonuclease domain-containing protein [Yersinia kristensenii]MDR4897534.1 ribonuclease domain-containing protein [Yersinia kristensenii]MDX6736440.1 ribonuclease domain-containing protein [Yersinia kristensenii]CNE90512.1 putative ribonuclease [Yersinia kristensenii]CNF32004.1 putative ribonuclease [Yersinia kristensenii]